MNWKDLLRKFRRKPNAASPEFPWKGSDSEISCNLACGNICNNLVERMKVDGRVHAETYVAAAGVISGYAAQRTLLAKGHTEPNAIVTTADGREFLYGDPINDALTGQLPGDTVGTIDIAVGAAIAGGLRQPKMEDISQHFKYVASQLGNPFFPSVPEDHHPHHDADELLGVLWPWTIEFLHADFDDLHRRFGAVPQEWWRDVVARSISRAITDVEGVLEPEHAMTIAIESAIYASKVLLEPLPKQNGSEQSLGGDSETRAEDGTVPGAPQG